MYIYMVYVYDFIVSGGIVYYNTTTDMRRKTMNRIHPALSIWYIHKFPPPLPCLLLPLVVFSYFIYLFYKIIIIIKS